MKSTGVFVLVILLVLFLGFSTVHAQEPTPTPQAPDTTQVEPPSQGPDITAVANGLKDPAFWWTFLLTVVFGAAGGVVYEILILQGRIEFPHKTQQGEVSQQPPYAISSYLYDLGVFARVIIGAMAALAAMWVLAPTTTFSLLATAIIAGSAGTALFRSLQDRLLAATALQTAAETQDKARLQALKVNQALEALQKIGEGARLTTEANIMATELSTPVEGLEQIERLLNEAKGISETF